MNTILEIMGRGIVQENGCVLWPGSLDGGGYARCRYRGPVQSVHKLLYEHFVGATPPGMVLDHCCPNRNCINFAHLEPVSSGENTRRGRRAQAELTHCPQGHPYAGDNLYVTSQGFRQCRQCSRKRSQRYAQQGKGRLRKDRSICIRGHKLEGDNLYTSPSGKRNCRACCRERDRMEWAKGRWRQKIERAHQREAGITDILDMANPTAKGCLEMQRTPLNSGYTTVCWKGKMVLAHRLVYQEVIGDIPKGAEVHHLCRNRLCVNPAHLKCVEVAEHRGIESPERDARTGRYLPRGGEANA